MFEQESGTAPGVELSTITDRMEIRKAVQSGQVEEAIDKVNDLNPEVRVQLRSSSKVQLFTCMPMLLSLYSCACTGVVCRHLPASCLQCVWLLQRQQSCWSLPSPHLMLGDVVWMLPTPSAAIQGNSKDMRRVTAPHACLSVCRS